MPVSAFGDRQTKESEIIAVPLRGVRSEYPSGDGGAERAFGAPLSEILDVDRWHDGIDLASLYSKLRESVAQSVTQNERTRVPLRRLLINSLWENVERQGKPQIAGLYRIEPRDIEQVHHSLLFNGATECCDGTVANHDSLLLTVAQIGVSLVSYQGNAGKWVQQLYRRELRETFADPMEEAVALLKQRAKRHDSADAEETTDTLSRLLRRGLMEYAERAILLRRATAPWRMGHGNPIPLSLLMVDAPALLDASIAVLQSLLGTHKKFVYVTSSPSDRLARTIGDALNPLEYAIIGDLGDQFSDERIAVLKRGKSSKQNQLRDFLSDLRHEIVYGVFRVAPHAPAQLFYAHREQVHIAAALAMADSVLQPHRGFPMLIDLADLVCRNSFDGGSFRGSVHDAYCAAGEPLRYLGERETRDH